MRYFQNERKCELGMIIEYAGLPGSGKTTLQQALASHFEHYSAAPTCRDVLQQQLIERQVLLRRYKWMRRASTALYKAQLTYLAMTSSEPRLLPAELGNLHLLRAAQRCIESQLLYGYIGMQSSQQLYDLDEGITQHFCSLRVWRRLLKPKQRPMSYDWLESHYQRQPHILLRLVLPPKIASARLEKRGRPSQWPLDVPTTEILDVYQEEFKAVDRLLQGQGCVVSDLRVDSNVSLEHWSSTAREIARKIVSPTTQL